MNYNELQGRKRKLTDKIEKLIIQFQSETGNMVENIWVTERLKFDLDTREYIHKLEVTAILKGE